MARTSFAAAALGLTAGLAAANANGCVFHTPGATYDLSALANREYLLQSTDGAFDYTVAICNPLKNLPLGCRGKLHSTDTAMGIQHDRHFGFCFTLGDVAHGHVSQADAANPGKGIDITYAEGARCSDGRPRELRLHLICSPHYDASHPPTFVIETPERCHYNVTWPSQHACPLGYVGSVTGGGVYGAAHRFVSHAFSTAVWAYEAWWVISLVGYIVLAVYIGVGCTMNAWAGRAEIGWDAMPHRAWWADHAYLVCPEWLKARLLQLPGADRVVAVGTGMGVVLARGWQNAVVAARTAYRRWRGLPDKQRKAGDSDSEEEEAGEGGDSGSEAAGLARGGGGKKKALAREGGSAAPLWTGSSGPAASAGSSGSGSGASGRDDVVTLLVAPGGGSTAAGVDLLAPASSGDGRVAAAAAGGGRRHHLHSAPPAAGGLLFDGATQDRQVAQAIDAVVTAMGDDVSR